MENKAFDIIPKAIGVFTSILVFLGIISSVVYYRSFSINILENITIGESLLLFISKFTALSISTVFGVLLSRIFLDSPTEDLVINKDNKLTQKLSLSVWQKLYLVIIITPLFLLSVMGFSPFAIWTLPISFLVRLYVLLYIVKRLRIVFQYKKIDSKFVDYILIAGISIILIVSIAMTEAYLVYSGHGKKTITLYYSKGSTLKTDSNTLYLGKSQLCYYLYDKINEKAIIIKSEQIERVEIK